MPRFVFDENHTVSHIELHAFSDASEKAYACVVYLRIVYVTGEVALKFLAAKAKVAPLKRQSIPRLELLGACLMSQLVDTIRTILQDELRHSNITTFYWVDSSAVLCWIINNKVWKPYVQNRVTSILSLSARGPKFLQMPSNEWPQQVTEDLPFCALSEERKAKSQPLSHALVSVDNTESTDITDVTRFSTKTKLLRSLAWAFRFIRNLKAKVHKTLLVLSQISAEEIIESEMKLVSLIQKQSFSTEIDFVQSKDKDKKVSSIVNQLNLFMDEQGVMRCRSRLRNSSVLDASITPILLPANHHFTMLVVAEAHKRVLHNGVRDTLNMVRQKYWILRGRSQAKKYIRLCTTCKRLEGKPPSFNLTPDLPDFRVDDAPPFTHTGVDFAGPLINTGIYSRRSENKCYVCLFTCASTRAVHLELVESLDVNAFIRCFRRFCARTEVYRPRFYPTMQKPSNL